MLNGWRGQINSGSTVRRHRSLEGTLTDVGGERVIVRLKRGIYDTPRGCISINWQYKSVHSKTMNNQHHACILETNYFFSVYNTPGGIRKRSLFKKERKLILSLRLIFYNTQSLSIFAIHANFTQWCIKAEYSLQYTPCRKSTLTQEIVLLI